MLLESSHEEYIDQVEPFFNDVINCVAFDEQHVFVSEVHMQKENGRMYMCEKGAAGALVSGRLIELI